MARRALFALAAIAVGVAATALSAALSWGPAHAWAWLSLPVQLGLLAGWCWPWRCCRRPGELARPWCWLALVLHLSLLNQAPASAYFADTLQAWEQGRFIRFNGLAQWLGWLWPYATLVYVLLRALAQRPRKIEWPHERLQHPLRTTSATSSSA